MKIQGNVFNELRCYFGLLVIFKLTKPMTMLFDVISASPFLPTKSQESLKLQDICMMALLCFCSHSLHFKVGVEISYLKFVIK